MSANLGLVEATRRPDFELSQAIRAGDLRRVERALDLGADPNRVVLALPPLARAVVHGHREIVELLIERGADLEATDDAGWTALTTADADENDGLGELLLDHGADPATRSRHGYSQLHRSARRGETGAVLRSAVIGGSVDPLDGAGQTPLALAVLAGHVATTRDLLDMGANPNVVGRDGWSVLAEAARTDATTAGEPGLVALLLDAGADPTPPGYPPLLACITQAGDSLAGLRALLAAGADPTVRDDHGDTLVHRVTQIGSDDAIDLVLSLGLSLEERDLDGRTPLLAVVHQENPAAIRRLLDAGANPTVTDATGASARDLAMQSRSPESLLAALEHTNGRSDGT